MALVAHLGLELHKMDIKELFLSGNIDETIYVFSQKILNPNIQSIWSVN